MRHPFIMGMTNAEYIKQRRAKAKANGQCYVCMCRPAKAGCSCCQGCIDRAKRKREAAKATKTVCVSCCSRRRVTRTLCRACRDRIRANSKVRTKKLCADGRCLRCLGPTQSGKVNCAPCAAIQSKRIGEIRSRNWHYWTKHGLCGVCAKPAVPGLTRCKVCRDRCREASARWVAKQKKAA